MTTARDVHDFLNSLLVTDRQALTFLSQNILETRELPAPEQTVLDMVKHVRTHQGKAPKNIKHWLGKLGSLQRRYQIAVIRVAGFYHDESLPPVFQSILGQLAHVALHPASVRALAQTMGIRASRGLTDMLWSTPPGQWHLRETAILRELGHLGWTSSIDHLIRALKVPFDSPARAAAGALARFEPDEVLDRLVSILDRPEDQRQQAGAAEALGLLGDPRALGALHKASRVSNPTVACAAAVAMARLGDAQAENFLVSMASTDKGHAHAEMRARAMLALGLLGQQGQDSTRSLEALIKGLKDSQPEVRSAAARSLGHLGKPRSAQYLAEAMRKEVSPLVRSALIQGLGLLRNSRSLPVLLDTLRKDADSVKIEVLHALALFPDPNLAAHIGRYRQSSNPQLADAAERALRRLLYRPFAWPEAAPLEEGLTLTIPLYQLTDARHLLLPPPPPPPKPSFFDKLFGGSSNAPTRPAPITLGTLSLSSNGLDMKLNPNATSTSWKDGTISWDKRFSLHVTREPIQAQTKAVGPEDIGVHFTLRQKGTGAGVTFETIAVSLWCAPSEAVGKLSAKSEVLPCLDPHKSDPLLAALRYYLEVHGEPLPFVHDEA